MRAVIFDFDGTIADSFGTVIEIAYQLTKLDQLADLDKVKWMRDNNVGLAQALKGLKISKWKLLWLLQRGRRLMADRIKQVPVFPGLEEVLRTLKQNRFQLYIVSTNSRSNVERFLKEKNLESYFNRIYGGVGLLEKDKVIKRVLKHERLDPSSAIYVGDEVRDIEAAKRLGMPCAAVAWGYNSDVLLASYAPMVVVRTPQQLEKVLTEWGR